jgi:3-hydroxyacyl-[acyl-carrier-protein] dehydratase
MITYMIETDVDRWLPQKKPFQFIDEVVYMRFPTLKKKRKDIVPKDLIGSEVVCKFYTDENLDFFKGHFPDNPTLPGVIQIEMMAQACSFTMRRKWNYEEFQKLGTALIGIENTRFKKPVGTNETLTITTKYVKVRNPLGVFDCKIENEQGDLVAQATLKSIMIEKE